MASSSLKSCRTKLNAFLEFAALPVDVDVDVLLEFLDVKLSAGLGGTVRHEPCRRLVLVGGHGLVRRAEVSDELVQLVALRMLFDLSEGRFVNN